jgi:hypothetical protein
VGGEVERFYQELEIDVLFYSEAFGNARISHVARRLTERVALDSGLESGRSRCRR